MSFFLGAEVDLLYRELGLSCHPEHLKTRLILETTELRFLQTLCKIVSISSCKKRVKLDFKTTSTCLVSCKNYYFVQFASCWLSLTEWSNSPL
jgi:hypothetical protein